MRAEAKKPIKSRKTGAKLYASTVSKPPVAHLSSASADRTQIYNSKAQNPRKIKVFRGFLIPKWADIV